MRTAISFSLLLLMILCWDGARPVEAASKPRGGPKITELTITPEHPAPGQEVTATIVIRDKRGVKGFRVILNGKTKDVSCGREKVCTRTFTKVIPEVSSPTVTLTIIAENIAGRRTRMEREIPLRLDAPSAPAPSTSAAAPPAPVPSASAAAPRASTPGNVKAFFRSGFEEGVTLRAPEEEKGDWVQYITGADQGFDWSRALPQRPNPPNRFTYLVSSRGNLQKFASARIETVTGHDGKSTRALYMELKKEDTSTKEGSRVQYGIYPGEDFKQAYVRYWVKFQPDLASAVLPPGTKKSRQIMEWKETGRPRADFRWGILIRRDQGSDKLFWGTRAQFGDLQKSSSAWECTSHVPVPVGEWFLLEVFWKLDPREGRVWGAANGQVFVDYKGRTQKDSSLFVWWPFKLYVGTALQQFERTPLYQWIDDVEFASEPPTPLPDVPRQDTCTCRTD